MASKNCLQNFSKSLDSRMEEVDLHTKQLT